MAVKSGRCRPIWFFCTFAMFRSPRRDISANPGAEPLWKIPELQISCRESRSAEQSPPARYPAINRKTFARTTYRVRTLAQIAARSRHPFENSVALRYPRVQHGFCRIARWPFLDARAGCRNTGRPPLGWLREPPPFSQYGFTSLKRLIAISTRD